ncbi:MAG: protoporphyrinogen oxidase [Bryobacteraceae bacterium]
MSSNPDRSAGAPVVIVGGGISGLSTAYYLAKAGIRPTVIEREPRLGGVITTESVEGCVIEGGPDSFLSAKPWALDLIRELGLAGDVIDSNDHRRVTYIWKNGRLVPMPDGLMMMVPTRVLPMAFSRLFSLSTKARMGMEYFRKPQPGDGRDRSVGEFIEEHYGREAVEYLAEPLLAGVFGGDPDQLSARSTLTRFVDLEKEHGSLTRGVLAGRKAAAGAAPGSLFKTLKRGLAQLVDALLPSIGNMVNGEVEAVSAKGVRIGGEWILARHVVLACPAHEAARLTEQCDPELAKMLRAIDYSSSITVALGFRRDQWDPPLDGFGFLVPKKERRDAGEMVACTWVGTKFPHRVPDSHALLRCFVRGDRYDEGVVREQLRRIMGVTAEPAFTRVFRWPRAMAQYTVGHAERQKKLDARMQSHSWLHLVGNGYHGIGIPDCIRLGKQAAERINGVPEAAGVVK